MKQNSLEKFNEPLYKAMEVGIENIALKDYTHKLREENKDLHSKLQNANEVIIKLESQQLKKNIIVQDSPISNTLSQVIDNNLNNQNNLPTIKRFYSFSNDYITQKEESSFGLDRLKDTCIKLGLTLFNLPILSPNTLSFFHKDSKEISLHSSKSQYRYVLVYKGNNYDEYISYKDKSLLLKHMISDLQNTIEGNLQDKHIKIEGSTIEDEAIIFNIQNSLDLSTSS